ncbi:hypothetical protein FHG87_021237 [Trinorchestia longiramus]|nr:hypothetical protein FHG87_021237 [Trinorchestia longiramus]
MSGHAQAAVPSQLPYKIGRQRSATRTLHQELSKSTFPPRTLITFRNQHTANSRAEETETNHPVYGQDGVQTTYALTRSARYPTRHLLQLYTSRRLADKTCTKKNQ